MQPVLRFSYKVRKSCVILTIFLLKTEKSRGFEGLAKP
jgi:hypothetical protein